MNPMKHVLITGAGSYIGNAVKEWLFNQQEEYLVDEIGLHGIHWYQEDFSRYDTIFHVAGLAHSDTGHATDETKKLYYKVNCDLAIDVAKKAKEAGVKQFIFMSSIIVYGESSPIGKTKRITANTVPNPANFYGDSKWQAELGLEKLRSDDFKIAIIRPPMIYGKGSKGNYPKLAKLARKLPLFPKLENERSMLHIDNLCAFIRLMIQGQEDGVFFPQNKAYVTTSGLVKEIAAVHGKKIHLTCLFNPVLLLLGKRVDIINKVFGNLSYDLQMSEHKEDYRVRTLAESIELTEK